MQLELFTQYHHNTAKDGRLYIFITWQAYDYRLIGWEIVDLGEVQRV